MGSIIQGIFLILCTVCLFGTRVGGQDASAQQMRHPLSDIPPPKEGVDVTSYYPKHSDLKFPIGESVTVLCHISNNGDVPVNVSAIMGSLNMADQFSFHIQNFSYKSFGIVVKPGDEYTLQYEFELHTMLEPITYSLAHTVFYEVEKEGMHASTFFNKTVDSYLAATENDLFSILQLLISFLFTAFVGFLVYIGCQPEKSEKFVKNVGKVISKNSSGGKKDDLDDWTSNAVVTSKKQK